MPDRVLPSLNAVRSFVAVARHLSFTKAADELAVTQGAVSRMMQTLQADLGVELIRRVGRGIELTPTGAAFYGGVGGARPHRGGGQGGPRAGGRGRSG